MAHVGSASSAGTPAHDLFVRLARYGETGAIHPLVHTVHPLGDIATAHRALEAGGVRGKRVIRVA